MVWKINDVMKRCQDELVSLVTDSQTEELICETDRMYTRITLSDSLKTLIN